MNARSEFNCSISCRAKLLCIKRIMNERQVDLNAKLPLPECRAAPSTKRLSAGAPTLCYCFTLIINRQLLNHVNGIKQLNRRQDLSGGVDNQQTPRQTPRRRPRKSERQSLREWWRGEGVDHPASLGFI